MEISPDQVVLWQAGPFALNATIVFTWVVMAILAVGAHLVTRNLSEAEETSRWQNLPEVLVVGLRDQIREVSRAEPGRAGTLPALHRHPTPTTGVCARNRSPASSWTGSPPSRRCPPARTRARTRRVARAPDKLHQ